MYLFLLSSRNTHESWEKSKKLWKDPPATHVHTTIHVITNFHSPFYNSIESQKIFYFLNVEIEKRQKTKINKENKIKEEITCT